MKLSQVLSSSDTSYSACSRSAAFDRPNKNDRIKIRFPEKKKEREPFISSRRFLKRFRARSLARSRIPDHDQFSKERQEGESCKETYSNTPAREWDNVEVGRRLSRIPKDFIAVIRRPRRTSERRRSAETAAANHGLSSRGGEIRRAG